MTEFLLEYGLFLAKTATVVAGILIIAGASITMSKRTRLPDKLEIKNLNHKFDQMQQVMKCELLSKKEWKKFHKEAKARLKAEKKQPHEENREKRIFVLNFHGDIKATAVASLREEITAVLTVAAANDEVVLRPGRLTVETSARRKGAANRHRGQGGRQRWLYDGLRGGPNPRCAVRHRRIHRCACAAAEFP
jgi:hypothetical protein